MLLAAWVWLDPAGKALAAETAQHEPPAACTALHTRLLGSAPAAPPTQDSSIQPALPPSRHGQATLGPRIRLLSWNLHKGADAGWRSDLGRLSADRDLLFLQEYRPSAGPRAHTHELQALHFAPGFGSGARRSGVATLSRHPAIAYCGLSDREPWLGTPKASALSLHPLSNGEALLAINLHGVNFSLGSRALTEQLQQLAPLLRAHRGPVILGGDINAWSTARLQRLRAFAAAQTLTEVGFQPDQRSRAPGLEPMDYLFYRGLHLRRAEVVPVRSSDHNPLLAEWQL